MDCWTKNPLVSGDDRARCTLAVALQLAHTTAMEVDPEREYDEPVPDERQQMETLARLLGITYDELCELELEVVEDSDEDGKVFSMTVFFEDGNPPEIMAKIAGVVDGQLQLDALG